MHDGVRGISEPQLTGPTPEKALGGIRKGVADVVSNTKTKGQAVPKSLRSRRYSGKFMLPIPPEVHHPLAPADADENISLN